MVIYFANRKMDTLGLATTGLQEGFIISDDLKTEDTDTGVATFECTIHWTDETRELAKACAAAGNYLLRSNDNENEFYTIIEVEEDTKDQTIYIYAEDAGMDLLNETVGAFAADTDYPIAWYVEKYAADTGFEIGLNEISDLSRKLEWTGEATSAERIASVATQFDNAEISYSFDIKGLTITHKYINIHKKRGKDAGIQLRLNREVDRIITTSSIADLATALYVTGGTPEGEEDPITLVGYKEEDEGGDIYTDGTGFVKSRSALATWSRYVWSGEPNTDSDHVGHIVKQWSYDTTSQSELFHRAVTQLSRICVPAVNYEIEIQQLPANVAIGDYIDIIDEMGELFLQSRILKLETSVCNEKQTATLGEFLIQDSGISQTVRELAEQFEILAKSRTFYTWTAYADDAEGNGISLDPTGKDYMGTAYNRSTATVDISDPSIFTWVKVTGTGIEEINVYYGVSDSPETVPTEWTTTPPEVLRNEYTWSYTEYIYTSGAVEMTTPHIIAYYDYLEVDALDARTANIESLLSGQIGTGELQTIHLTADNVVIDDAVVNDLIAARIDAGKIVSGTIYTDYVKIANNAEGQNLWIDGASIQFTDANGTVREQLGMDASGNYNNYIWDEDGNLIWNALGLTEEGLLGNGAIIRNDAVAEDAAIAGSKLDIVSVANAINENGNAIINAANVYIGDDSMEVLYTTIEQDIKNLEGVTMDGITKITPVYAVGDSSKNPPSGTEETTTLEFSKKASVRENRSDSYYFDVSYTGWTPTRIVSYKIGNGAEETGAPALNGNEVEFGLIGYDDVDVTISFVVEYVRYAGDASWSEDQPIDLDEGQYVWMCYRCEYLDGHEEYSNPILYVDATAVSVLQTEFSVINGQISSKIWMDDISSAVEVIDGSIDSLSGDISDLLSNVNGLSDALKSLTDDVSGMELEITSIHSEWSSLDETVNNIKSEVGDMTTTIASITDTQSGIQTQVAQLESNVSSIEETSKSITSRVQSVESDITTIMAEGVSKLTPYFCANTSTSTAPSDSAGWSIAYPSTTSGQYVWIKYLLEYEDGHTEWSTAYCLSDEYARSQISAAWTTINQTADEVEIQAGKLENIDGQLTTISSSIEAMPNEIMLQVSEGYVTKGSLVLELDTKTGEATLSASANKIVLDTGELVITSGRFQLTEDGYIVIDNSNFQVTKDGFMTAKSGTIANWNITTDNLNSSGENGNIILGGGDMTVESTWGASIDISGADVVYKYNGTAYGELGMLAANLGTGSSAIHTYTPCLWGASGSDGVTLGYYGTKSGVSTVYPAISVLQGDLFSYYGEDTYRIYFHESTYIGTLTAYDLTVTHNFTFTPTAITYSGTTYGYRVGRFVWIRIYGVAASTLQSAFSAFPTPAVNVSFPMVFVNNSNEYLGYVYYSSSNGWQERVAPSYGGGTYSGTQYSSGSYYGVISYFTS